MEAVYDSTEAPQDGSPPTLSSSLHQDDQVNEAEGTQNLRCPEHGDDSDCRSLGLGTKQREEITARLLDPVHMCVMLYLGDVTLNMTDPSAIPLKP